MQGTIYTGDLSPKEESDLIEKLEDFVFVEYCWDGESPYVDNFPLEVEGELTREEYESLENLLYLFGVEVK